MQRLTLVLVALAAIVAIATPAVAEYNFYGSVRLETFYVDNDKNAVDDQDFSVQLQKNTRFGAKYKSDKIGGRIEFGLLGSGDGNNTMTRLAYGTYKSGAGLLLVGQTYSPYFSNAKQVFNDDNAFAGFGNLFDARNPQVRFDFNSGLYVAATQVVSKGNSADDTMLPKMTVGFKSKSGQLAYNVGAVYQQFDTDPVAEVEVTSYMGYADLTLKLEQVKLRTKLHYGQNLSELGISGRNSKYVVVGDNDTSSYGGWLEAGFGPAYAGIGYVVDDLDGAAETDEQMALFVNYRIKLAKGVTITPEVLYKDFMDSSSGADQGDELAVGAQWKMDF